MKNYFNKSLITQKLHGVLNADQTGPPSTKEPHWAPRSCFFSSSSLNKPLSGSLFPSYPLAAEGMAGMPRTPFTSPCFLVAGSFPGLLPPFPFPFWGNPPAPGLNQARVPDFS